jgi:DNA repair protein RadA/Sms
MAKIKTTYFCQSCGSQSPKWLGKCPACNEWNTFVEEIVSKGDNKQPEWKSSPKQVVAKPIKLRDVAYESHPRVDANDDELNRVLGGGIVAGSITLVGGEPGIGKSTLMLQLALKLKNRKVLYISGEESEAQIKMRADRMGVEPGDCYLFAETNTQNIFKQIEQLQPDIVITDSIQTVHSSHIESASGTVSQVRECAAEFMRFAKETGTPVFLVGHITKDGSIAGPKVLEHMVDTVLLFEGDRHMSYRILRTMKNRFGSTAELGIYEMQSTGLRLVTNPSEILLSQREGDLAGISIAALQEGNRPLLVEIQALVSNAAYGTPQRSCTGYDVKRMNMLLAVLEKRGGFRLGAQDVFLNIAGGLKVDDPATDLAICASIVSSYEEISIPVNYAFAGEIGLGGEVRAVNKAENRIAEAGKLGFDKIYVSKFNKGDFSKIKGVEIVQLATIDELFADLFG